MEQAKDAIICPYCKSKQQKKVLWEYEQGKNKCEGCQKEYTLRMEYEISYITTMNEEPELPKKY